MKKALHIVLVAVICVMMQLSSFMFAQGSLDGRLSSILGGFGNFGYVGTNISVQSTAATSVTFASPVIRDESQNDVLKYVLWYGPYPFGKLLDGSSGVSTADFQSKEFIFPSHNAATFTMTLTTADGIVPTQLYYATVVPIASNGDSGEMSGPDVCFRLQPGQSAVGVQCNNLATGTHNSAGANMQLANVSNTCNGNQITLTWNSVPGAQRVRIYRVVNGQQGTLIGERNMTDQQHVYALPNPTPPEVVRFVPIDSAGNSAGTQVDYTLQLCTPTPTPTPTTPAPKPPSIPTVPKVWPEQDIVYVLLATLFMYGVLRVVKSRKAK